MSLRWLWFNHFPPDLELTAVDRHKAKQMASVHWKRDRKYHNAHRAYYRVFIPAACLATVVMVLAILGRNRFHLPASAGMLSFHFIFYTGLAYAVHCARRPFIRKALNDLGHPVCIDCGYILKNLPADVRRCPECGAVRE